jgi:hypothetical protein
MHWEGEEELADAGLREDLSLGQGADGQSLSAGVELDLGDLDTLVCLRVRAQG